jgi:hypothetical protein
MMATSQQAWQCNYHDAPSHEFFISYRVDSDKDTAARFHLEMEAFSFKQLQRGQAATALCGFIDAKCLNPTEDWQDGFLHGLQTSKVVVYLISDISLQVMENKLDAGIVSILSSNMQRKDRKRSCEVVIQ